VAGERSTKRGSGKEKTHLLELGEGRGLIERGQF
jgi:hypothetical protein